MTTSKPRITVNLTPEGSRALKRLAAANGSSQSFIVADLVDMAAPTFERVATVLELAAKAQESSRQTMRSDLADSQRRIEDSLGGITGELDRLLGAMGAPSGMYSALAPDGERVLLPVGHYFDKSGKLRTGPDTDASAAVSGPVRSVSTPLSNRGVRKGKTRTDRPSKPGAGKP